MQKTYGRVQQLIKDDLQLPTPPAIALKILNTVRNDESGMGELVDILATDPALTAKMLRIANSSLYSLQNRVVSLERCVAVLGTNLIQNIALSFVIATNFRGESDPNFNFDHFWRRSLTAAVAAEILSKALERQDDDIFVTALLHDIGVLTTYLNKRAAYSKLIRQAQTTGTSLSILEHKEFGYDHQQVALALIKEWALPEQFAAPIAFHHAPENAPEDWRHQAEIIYLADQLAAIYTEPNSSGTARELQSRLHDKYGLDNKQIRELFDNVATQSIEILNTFNVDPADMKPYSQMLQEANEELGRLNLSYEQLVMELKDAKQKSEQLAEQLKDVNLKLNELVYTDGLTGLYNHRYFQETLVREFQRAKRYNYPLTLILFDLDHFKKINDSYGHPTGDLVLAQIASSVEKTVRPSDTFARYGGEEFAIILPRTDISGSEVFARRLCRYIAETGIKFPGGEIFVTISVGATTYIPDQNRTLPEQLLKMADKGLYLSKHGGRNCATILPLNSDIAS